MWKVGIPKNLELSDVHIWQASLAVSSGALQHYAQTLGADEQKRADRFRFSRDSHRFIVGRGILRALLGRYLALAPEQLQFCYGDSGKPALANVAALGLTFNLSHSEDLMVCAIARDCCVGIDLEHIRPIANLEDLTQRFFSPQEHTAIHASPEPVRLRSFFQHWTCKEALLKATGDGLMNLSTIEVNIQRNQARLLSWSHATHTANSWMLQLFAPTPAYVAAVALDSQRAIAFWQWDDAANL